MYGHIYRKVIRPSAELVREFSLLPTATISDGLGRHGALDVSIQPLYHEISMAGVALTVLCYPGDNVMTHRALEMVQPGDVLVIDDGDYTTGCFGHRSAMLMRARGGVGAVMSGSARDARELRRDKFPIFCRGVSPRAPQKNTPGSINVPVHVGGVVVHPGDIVVGDDDGVVVVPLAMAEAVLARSKARDRHERASTAKEGELPLDPAGGRLDLDRLLRGKVIEHDEEVDWTGAGRKAE
jgi:4-hydroxy-4-methyl-2-oxoglutarate aldolase